MNPFLYRLICIILLAISNIANAATSPTENTIPEPPMRHKPDVYCTDDGCNHVSPWNFGIGIGSGRRNNPLINSSDININWFVDLAYFGDHFFFDNGDLGFAIKETDKLTVNAIVSYGNEKAFFSHLNDETFSLPGFNRSSGVSSNEALDQVVAPSVNSGSEAGAKDDSGTTQGNGNNQSTVTTQSTRKIQSAALPTETNSTVVQEIEAPNRRIAIEGGLEIFYDTNFGRLQSQLLSDISSTHNGQELWFSYSYPINMQRWQWLPAIGFTWKSGKLTDYYYGVRDDEISPALSAYSADSTIDWFAKLTLAYKLSKHWQVVGVLEYEKFGSEITNSPLVADKYLRTYFLGIFYRF